MNRTFLDACFQKKTDYIPVWFMRQAGRSLPGYRKLREKYDVLTLTQTPELAAQVSLEPIERLGVDAAILFADIMLLPIAMGINVKIVDHVGPIVESPIKTNDGVGALQPFQSDEARYLADTIKILRGELKVPLIGFSGAPFTLASYLIEGAPTRTWTKTKEFMLNQPRAWRSLMEMLSDGVIKYLSMQIEAGAQAIQIFDSWAGALAPGDYRRYVLPYMQRVFAALRDKNVPRIHFGTNTGGMLADFSNVDCEVISVDWRIDIAAARKMIGDKAIQGNLDPASLLASQRTIEAEVDEMLAMAGSRVGYIFNLGHGILPETDDRKVRKLVEYIHEK